MPPKTTKKKRARKRKKKASPNGRAPEVPPYINPALAPTVRSIEGLVEDPRNARLHPARNLDDIRRSLAAFRQQTPIVALKDGKVIKGCGTLRVALALGWDKIACIVFDGTAEDALAYGIADNRTGESSEWDDAKLADLLTGIDGDVRINTGFDETEIGELLKGLGRFDPPPTPPDILPTPPDEPKTAVGDLWLLGEHRLLCGDSTKAGDVGQLIEAETVRVCITDPPYSVDYGRSQEERGGHAGVHQPYHETIDAKETLRFLEFLPCDVLVMTYAIDRNFHELAQAFERAKLELRKELVWVKESFSFWRGAKYQQRHESILVCARRGKPVNADVPSNVSTVFEIARPKAHELHPTARPIELWNQLVLYHAAKGDIVYDPFCGSGTTIVACEQHGRRCFAIEIEPRYVDVAVARWEEYSGRTAERVTPGQQ